jgi:1-acyl-sn-glycerol-3-phosphate acyltransferase
MILLRSTLFNVYFFGVTFLLTLAGTVARLFSPDRVMSMAMLWGHAIVAGARVICGIRLEVIGGGALPVSGPALIASRHQSAFDTVVWLTLLPRCCYVLKHELMRIPLFGSLIRASGMIAVDRAGGAAAMRHMLREADRAVREERQIVIFPEGTRAEPGATLPLQPGVAALAARTRLPVIPVITDSGHCWGRRAFNKRPGVIHIRILPPIAAGTSRETLMQELNAALRGEMGPCDAPVDKIVHEVTPVLRRD